MDSTPPAPFPTQKREPPPPKCSYATSSRAFLSGEWHESQPATPAEVIAAQVDLVGKSLEKKKQDEISARAVRDWWLAATSGHQLTEEEEIFPLEDCEKGDEIKRVSLLNK